MAVVAGSCTHTHRQTQQSITGKQADAYTDRQTDVWTDVRTDVQMDRQTKAIHTDTPVRQTNRWTDVQMDGQTDRSYENHNGLKAAMYIAQ